MPFYQLPRMGQKVIWPTSEPQTIVRFGPGGGLVVMHATTDETLTAGQWLTQQVELALFGLDLAAPGPETPPVLCLRLGEGPVLTAPVCILELRQPKAMFDWLTAPVEQRTLRLVLLRQSGRQGQAVIEASRRVWAPEWQEGEALLRPRLEQQILRTDAEAAGEVQAAGRALVAATAGECLLDRAEFRLLVGQAGEVGQLV